jgi:ArsR family transcriptional regulator
MNGASRETCGIGQFLFLFSSLNWACVWPVELLYLYICINRWNQEDFQMSHCVELFKALADETRLRILNLLSRRELCVCQIVKVLGIGQSKASRHLAHLRNAGVVTDRRDGLWIHYSLAPPSGDLHRRLIEWLRQAENQIPRAAADLAALGDLGECDEVWAEQSVSKRDEQREGVQAVGS